MICATFNPRVGSDIEIVAAGIEGGEQSASSQAEGRVRLCHKLSARRLDGETPDGEAGSRSHRVNQLAGGIDNNGTGAATIHRGEGGAGYGSQCAAAGVDIEPGNVAHRIRIRRRVACRYVRYVEEPVTAIHYQGGRSRSRNHR